MLLVGASGLGAEEVEKGEGDSKFGIFFKFKADKQALNLKEGKITYELNPELGAKMFGGKVSVIDADAVLSTKTLPYRSEWNDVNNNHTDIFGADLRMRLRLFGITLWSKYNQLDPSFCKGSAKMKKCGIQPESKWNRREFPTPAVPVGPVVVQASAGYSVGLGMKPDFDMDFKELVAEGDYGPEVTLAGTARGSVSLLVLRGGVGGEVNLLKGKGGVGARLALKEKEYLRTYLTAKLNLLSGRLFAFVESRSVKCCFKISWKKIVDITLVKWNGFERTWNQNLFSLRS